MKSNSKRKPNPIEYIGNGKWCYNYNISETTIEHEIFYNYDQIILTQEPTYKTVVPAIIRETYSETNEISIINKYNGSILGVIPNDGQIEKYKDFLVFVDKIKNLVKKDFS